MPLPADYPSVNQVITARGRRLALTNLVHETWTNPAVLDVDGLLVAVAGRGSSGTTTYLASDSTLDGALVVAGVCSFAHPRNIVITVTHNSSIVAMSGVITGTDLDGQALTEAWAVTATGTTKTFTGKKAFKTITSITEVTVADASTDTVVMGTGAVLGLSGLCILPKAVLELYDGSIVTNGTIVAGVTGATTDSRGTYTPNTAPDGAHDYEVVYVVDQPQNS